MVQQQKQREGAVASRVLAELLGDAVLVRHSNRATHRMPDTLIPVPLHWRREGQRGHNQSALLAAHLGRRLHIPVGLNIAHRSRATASQQQLNIAARTVNMANAFQITGTDAAGQHPELRNTCIAIIDDVVTTGATARALAQSLQSAGAAEVHLWSPTRAILAPDDS